MQISEMTTRQKVTIGAFVLILVVIVWQVIGLFKSSKPAPAKSSAVATNASPEMAMPKPASLPKPQAMTERETALLKAQQQLEEKYVAAINELQMLRLQKDIAEASKAIATAKLDTVKAQKDVVDLLSKPMISQAAYAQGLSGGTSTVSTAVPPTTTSSATTPTPTTSEASYVIISVSQLQNRWSAVLGYQGRLFNVNVGDILPADNSKVININKSGVVLEKDGTKKTISLLPII